MKNVEKKLNSFGNQVTRKSYNSIDLRNVKNDKIIVNCKNIQDNTGFCKPAIVFLFLSKS